MQAGARIDPVAALVICCPGFVDLSVINGRIVVQDGKFTELDLQARALFLFRDLAVNMKWLYLKAFSRESNISQAPNLRLLSRILMCPAYYHGATSRDCHNKLDDLFPVARYTLMRKGSCSAQALVDDHNVRSERICAYLPAWWKTGDAPAS